MSKVELKREGFRSVQLAIILLAGLRQKMAKYSNLPKGLSGKAIAFIVLGILSLAFIGFTGLSLF